MSKRREMKVYAYTLGNKLIGTFNSQNEAERKLHIGSGNVSRVINGKLDAARSSVLSTYVVFKKDFQYPYLVGKEGI